MADAETDQRASLIAFAVRLIETANDQGFPIRALGGIAVALRCPSAQAPGPLARQFSDIDLVVTRKSIKPLTKLLREHGCVPNERFNAANGDSRLLFFFGEDQSEHMDVFVDRFQLCHELRLAERLRHDNVTVSLADLLLTKLQVAKLSHKDVTDAAALLLDHPLTADESGINAEYVTELLASDWGWWRTSTETLAKLEGLFASLNLPSEMQQQLAQRRAELAARIEERPKTLKWKARARVGERRPWRIDPDDVSP
jgi:hypothetical protein